MAQVLVVDDEPDIRMMVRALLAIDGWEVADVSSGSEAIEYCLEQPPDAVILDQKMPGLTGIETARRLRDSIFQGPIVLFSAYLDKNVESAAEPLGLVVMNKSESVHLSRRIRSLLANE